MKTHRYKLFTNINLTLIFICIFSNLSFSQKLNLNDLKFVYEHHIESVDSYLLKKGFNFYKREIDEGESQNVYTSKNQTYIIKHTDEPNTGMSWYQLYDSNIYNSIKDECKKNGYIFSKTWKNEIPGHNLNYVYTNNKLKVTFSSLYEQNITKYFISLTKVYPHEL